MSKTKRILIANDDANFVRFALNEKERMRLPDPKFKPVKGEKGDKGDMGAQGEDGKDGEKGERGKRGKIGGLGRDGLDGKNGLDGTDGADGKDGFGTAGTGIRNAFIEKGQLILEYDDGTKQNVGKVVSKGSEAQGAGWGMKLDGSAQDRHLTVLAGTSGSWKKTTGIHVDEEDVISGIGGIHLSTVFNSTITVEEDYTADDKRTILVDASSRNVTITLPTTTDNAGLTYNVMKIDSSSNTVTVKGDDTDEKINGEICQVISQPYTSVSPEVNDLETMWFVI